MRRIFLIVWLAPGCAAPDAETRFWLENMVRYHRFADAEVAAALRIRTEAVAPLLARYGIDRQAGAEMAGPDAAVRVLPYPGGRHPRIGFLEGAIDPERGTKVSVFTPWEPRSYVVVDLPEAIWWRSGGERELLYLAHTHIPTHWDKASVKLEPIDWTRHGDGSLALDRRLPNGVAFHARVEPRVGGVAMELTLVNGSAAQISGLQTQVCVMLKGAPAFRQQTGENKITVGDAVACRSAGGSRYVVTAWQGGRVWNNERCPCMHSDPGFPPLAPGERATVRGVLFFYEGQDLTAEVHRRRYQLEGDR